MLGIPGGSSCEPWAGIIRQGWFGVFRQLAPVFDLGMHIATLSMWPLGGLVAIAGFIDGTARTCDAGIGAKQAAADLGQQANRAALAAGTAVIVLPIVSAAVAATVVGAPIAGALLVVAGACVPLAPVMRALGYALTSWSHGQAVAAADLNRTARALEGLANHQPGPLLSALREAAKMPQVRDAAARAQSTTTTTTTTGGAMLPGRNGTTADLEVVGAIWPALAAYIDNGTPLRVPPLAAAGSPQADVVRAIVQAVADDETRTHPKGQPSQLSSEARARVERVRSLLDQSRQWPRGTNMTASIPAPTARSLTARVAWSPSGVTSTGGITTTRGITVGRLPSHVALPPVPASQPAAAGGGLALGALALIALSVLR